MPLIVSFDKPYYLFNCLSYGIDDLEACKSIFQDDSGLGVTKLVSKPKYEEQLLFKSEYERGHTLLCSQRFTDIINQLGLTGLRFDSELVKRIDL